MRILLIGATGFIGRHLVPELAPRHELCLLQRGRTLDPFDGAHRRLLAERRDLPKLRQQIEAWKPQVVIDLIPYFAQDAWDAVRTLGSICRRAIVLSSGDVYRSYEIFRDPSLPPRKAPDGEDSPLRHRLYPYRTPDGKDELMQHYDKIPVERIYLSQPQMPATILRLGAVYGPHDRQGKGREYLLPMLRGEEVLEISAEKAAWRWTRVYVREVARAIRLVLEEVNADTHQIYNVGEAHTLSQLELIQRLKAQTGWRGTVRVQPAPESDGLNYRQPIVLDSTRIRQDLGYEEAFTLEEGWGAVIDFLRKGEI